MHEEVILSAVSKYIELSEKEKGYFVSLLEFKKIKAKTILLQAGTICRHSSFVVKGCLRGYTVDNSGFEHILSFAAKGWWIADLFSLLSQQPGMLNIEAMTDSELLLLSKKNQEQLYVNVPKFERFFRILTENSLVSNQQRLIDNLSLTASERYLKFCKTYPGLTDDLPQKHVAAYIGVTPEFLSKMKKRLPPSE